MRLNEWMTVWCSESGNFAARVALMVKNSSFLVHSRSSTQCINQSFFLAEPDGWLTCAKRQNAKLSKVVSESFPPRKENQKALSKSTKFPPSSKDGTRINSPALSTNIWARLEVFSLSVCPPCFSDNCASLLAQKARYIGNANSYTTQPYVVSSRFVDALILLPQHFSNFF